MRDHRDLPITTRPYIFSETLTLRGDSRVLVNELTVHAVCWDSAKTMVEQALNRKIKPGQLKPKRN